MVQISDEVFGGKKVRIHAEAYLDAQFSVATNRQVLLASLESGSTKPVPFLAYIPTEGSFF